MKKKIAQKLCLLLSLVILLSCFPVTAFADDPTSASPEYTVTIIPETTTTAVGNTVSFTAAVQKNGVETSLEDNGRLWFFADIWQTGHEDGITGDENIKFSDSDGTSLTTEATLHTAGTYYVAAEYKVDDNRKAIAYATITALTASEGYSVTITPSKAVAAPGDTLSFTAALWKDGTQIALEENGKMWFYGDCWNEYADGNSDAIVTAGNGDGSSLTAEVTFPSVGTYYIAAKYERDGSEAAVVRATVTVENKAVPSPDPVDDDIFVEKVELSDDFIWGADVSSLLADLRAGARFQNFEGVYLGNTVEEQGQGFMRLLKESGYNWIRLRVWNDPYNSENRKGYGGGNNDIDTAVTIGKWATDAGLRVLIDFHYSDFWADPGKQWAPKAWRNLTFDELKTALSSYTKESLQKLADAGVDVGMVQVGNETNGKMCGQDWNETIELFKVGSAAVRETLPHALVALHFANPHSEGRYAGYAKDLANAGVDYDVFASSYYPADSAQCTPETLTRVLSEVAETYGKKVMVAETSSRWKDRSWEPENAPYWYNPQGQADELVDTAKAVKAVGEKGLGVFYWENAWLPVESTSGVTDQDKLDTLYYAGWASPYSQEYWTMNGQGDNGWGDAGSGDTALFDTTGRPLITLKLRELMKTGKQASTLKPMKAMPVEVKYLIGDEISSLPTTVKVVYNDRSVRDEPVNWVNPPEIDNQTVGEYTIEGTAAGLNATMKVSVRYPNLLQNPGFEDEDVSMYQISDNNAAKRSNEDPYEGNAGLHYFFSGDNMTNFTVEQNVTLDAGTYVFTFWVQGHDNGEKYPDAFVDTYAYVKVGDQILKDNFALTGWAQWKAPTIRFTLTQKTAVTVGANITSAPGAWGTIDNFNLYAPLSADTPTQPTNPDETEQPGEPERPGESENPSEPEQPYKPDQSGTGNSTTNNSTAPNTNTNDANGTTTVSVTTSKTNNIRSEKSATPIKTDTIPQTADGFPQTFMIGLMMISLAAFGVLFFWKKKADVATKNQ